METTVPSVKSLLVRARISLAEAAEARKLSCAEVRLELGEAAEGLSKLSSPARRHVRGCERCRSFKKQLKDNNHALAAMLPVGPLLLAKKLFLAKLGSTASAGGAHVAGGAGATSAPARAVPGQERRRRNGRRRRHPHRWSRSYRHQGRCRPRRGGDRHRRRRSRQPPSPPPCAAAPSAVAAVTHAAEPVVVAQRSQPASTGTHGIDRRRHRLPPSAPPSDGKTPVAATLDRRHAVPRAAEAARTQSRRPRRDPGHRPTPPSFPRWPPPAARRTARPRPPSPSPPHRPRSRRRPSMNPPRPARPARPRRTRSRNERHLLLPGRRATRLQPGPDSGHAGASERPAQTAEASAPPAGG